MGCLFLESVRLNSWGRRARFQCGAARYDTRANACGIETARAIDASQSV